MRGTSIGRFLVLDRLGEGGMGVVYAAYDPELDRKVALKLLRSHLGESADFRARLQREAQAMARLSHANVVSVFDVGTFENKVFVAMEFIDGRTLGAWLKEKPRSWREVLAVFRWAGAGLAAAHAAGLVHRDFKPSNVLVRRDEVVKVTDFGLALSHPSAPGRLAESADAADSSRREGLESGVTPRSSPGVGTPGYMAPEQIRGEPVDARADQYSFCVTLHEALVGERPSEGETRATVQSELKFSAPRARGQELELPRDVKLPAWVLRPLLRGLSPNPADRYPTLDELLAALADEPRSKWRRALAIAAAAAVLAGSVAAYGVVVQRHALICKGAEAKLAGIWDAPRQEMIQRAFLSTAKPFARAAFNEIKTTLNAQTNGWVAMHTDACEATRLRREQSEALLDLRMDCLRRRLDEVRALSDVFGQADALIVEKAVEAAHSLTPLGGCADVASLTAPVKLPENAAARAAVEKLRSALADARALRDTGNYLQGLERAKPIAAEASKVGYKPLEAEALHLLGDLQAKRRDASGAQRTLYEAGWSAEAGRHDEVKAKVWMDLVQLIASTEGRFEQAHQLARQAVSVVERLENPLLLNAQLQHSVGTLFYKEGKYEEALGRFQQSVELREKALGPDDPQVASALSSAGSALRKQGKYPEALACLQRALAISEKTLGPDHPLVAVSLSDLGIDLRRLGQFDAALESHQRALSIQEKVFGPESLAVASSLDDLGSTLSEQGRYAEALTHLRHALAIKEKTLGEEHLDLAGTLSKLGNLSIPIGDAPAAVAYDRRALAIQQKALGQEHPVVAVTLSNLGEALYEHDELQAALEVSRRALAMREKLLGPDHPVVASTLHHLGTIFDEMKNPTKALTHHQRALNIIEKAYGPEHPRMAAALTALGLSYIFAGRPLEAIPRLERALALHKSTADGSLDLSETRFTMARALWDSGKERERALALGQQAYAAFVKAGAPRSKAFRPLEAWLLPKLKGRAKPASAGM